MCSAPNLEFSVGPSQRSGRGRESPVESGILYYVQYLEGTVAYVWAGPGLWDDQENCTTLPSEFPMRDYPGQKALS